MKRLYMVVALLALTTLQAMAAADVTVRINDDHSAVLSNGTLEVTVNPKGKITGCFYRGEDLFGKQGTIYFSCNQPNYSELKATKVEVVSQSDDYAEILYTNEMPKNIKWQQGYILRKGVNGIYSYVVAEGVADDSYLKEARLVYRLDGDKFTYGYVNDQMQGEFPPVATMKAIERTAMIQDATFRLPSGEIYTKYNWSNYIADDHFHGMMSDHIGVWAIPVTPEYINGGPLKQELTVHTDTKSPLMLQMFQGEHFGSVHQEYVKGDRKLYGPFLMYFNEGTRQQMIADARQQTATQEKEWPFRWFSHDLHDTERATVTGRIQVTNGFAPARLQVILAEPGKDVNAQGKGYIFWAATDRKGNFSIPKVRRGKYSLYVYALEGENTDLLEHTGIEVTKGGKLNIGTVKWAPKKYEHLLWRIGEADRLSDGFKLADSPRAYGLFDLVPDSLTYVVGKSHPARDWYFIESRKGSRWTIEFDLDKTYTGEAHLTISAAAATQKPRMVYELNGQKIGELFYPDSDGSIYRSGVRSGAHQLKVIDFPASTLKMGKNVLTISIPSVKEKGGLMWDCLKLETGKEMKQ